MLTLVAPIWLLALLPLPWVWYVLRRRYAARPAALMLRHPVIEREASSAQTTQSTRWVPLLWVLTLASMIAALGGPEWQGSWIKPPPATRSILLLVDASPSMNAADFPTGNGQFIPRMAAMKQGLIRFIQSRPQDRFSIIVVTDSAGRLLPMTSDHQALEFWIRQLSAGVNGSATALGDGLALAIRDMTARSHAGQQPPLLIVWTDGFSTGGIMTPGEALALARANQIHIYTVNLAPAGSAPDDGQPTLAELADLSGGRPILAGDLAAMNQVTDTIARSEVPETVAPTARIRTPLQTPLLILAVILFLWAGLLDLRQRGAA
ncbi:vWA domain-containing protein [Halothiobacillus sp.]|uniref:vWA domain-containing protein n=1 Tax=Halothiobacillus sp. TaxID=1891311 RepID=UPI002AD2DF15|nr:VWA domain-containing protein [Halothiobacillus sp.]